MTSLVSQLKVLAQDTVQPAPAEIGYRLKFKAERKTWRPPTSDSLQIIFRANFLNKFAGRVRALAPGGAS